MGVILSISHNLIYTLIIGIDISLQPSLVLSFYQQKKMCGQSIATQLDDFTEHDTSEPIPALLVNSQPLSQNTNGQWEPFHYPTLNELLFSLKDLCTKDEDAYTSFKELLNSPPAPPSPPLTPPPIPPFQLYLEHYLRDTRHILHRL
jgi:hypothetical protein